MLRVGLWNTNKQPVANLLSRLAAEYSLNVLVLLELHETLSEILETLNATKTQWFSTRGYCPRVSIFTKFSDKLIKPISESDTHTIRRIALPGLPDVLLIGVHLTSKLRQSEGSQRFGTIELARDIRKVEEKCGHQRTILTGDFNMNPDEEGMLAANTLHGMMTRASALKKTRIVERREYPMFYNPMWGFFGDRVSGPPGTYRYWNAEHVCREWNIFDQVLVRPALIPFLPVDRVRILDEIGQERLTSKQGIPKISDHLPVIFEILEPGATR